MPNDRVIAIGDVHGCVHALDALVEAISPTAADTLVFLGDLIDQGHETRDVLDAVIELQKRCRVVLIQGNHEEMLQLARRDSKAIPFWEDHGGVQTLNSYRFGGSINNIFPEHLALLDQCQPYFETETDIFTHANYLPDEPMALQPGHILRWAIFETEDVLPHISVKRVTVGHTEQLDGEIVDLGFATCIDTACWRNGWLTAFDRTTGQIWQASRWGRLREPEEASHRHTLTPILAGARM